MMLHKLALRLGRTVAELRVTMGVDELTRWMAFDRLTPIGDERLDYALANVCTVVSNVAGAKRRGGGAFRLEDFLLWRLRPEEKPIDFLRSRLGALVVKRKRR